MSSVGMEWLPDEIEELIPLRDGLHRFVIGQRPHSYCHRFGFEARGCTPNAVKHALISAIQVRPLFRARVINLGDNTPYLVSLKTKPRVINSIIGQMTVQTVQQLSSILKDEPVHAFSFPLTVRAVIISVQETGKIFLSLTLRHIAFDVISLFPFCSDLDKLLDSPSWIPPQPTPFKMFADLAALYATSPSSRESVNYHLERLRGISRLSTALFPRQRAPGWMIASEGPSHPHLSERESIRRRLWTDWLRQKEEFKFPRHAGIICLPGIQTLKKKYNVHPKVVLKAAVALMNIAITGVDAAIFSAIENGRSWPFISDWMHTMIPLPPIMGVDGPTLEWVLNIVRMPAFSSRTGKGLVKDWLVKLSHEQFDHEKYAHAPWSAILQGLGEEAQVAEDASVRQTVVWDVTLELANLSGEHRRLVPIARYDWADSGLFWNACMLGNSNMYLVATWDTAQMNNIEIHELFDRVADFLRRLCDEASWERSVHDILHEHLEIVRAPLFCTTIPQHDVMQY